jgi:hypothetical protein
MEIANKTVNGVEIAVVHSDEPVLTDVQSALDLLASVSYTGCSRIVVDKSAICEDFFRLRTRLAGEILQKFVNYRVKLAIVGDFSVYDSKALRDFIRESNRGHDIFFVTTEGEALQRLSAASAD